MKQIKSVLLDLRFGLICQILEMDDVVESIQQQLERERKLYQNMRITPIAPPTNDGSADYSWRQESAQGIPLKKQDSDSALARKIALASKKASTDTWTKILDKEQKTALKVILSLAFFSLKTDIEHLLAISSNLSNYYHSLLDSPLFATLDSISIVSCDRSNVVGPSRRGTSKEQRIRDGIPQATRRSSISAILT